MKKVELFLFFKRVLQNVGKAERILRETAVCAAVSFSRPLRDLHFSLREMSNAHGPI